MSGPMIDATTKDPLDEGEMRKRYKAAVEIAISHLPVKNGVVDIDSIWVETSIPMEILRELVKEPDLKLPENVERINTKPRTKGGGRRGKSRGR